MYQKPSKTYIRNLGKPRCPECGLMRGHKKVCLYNGTRNTEPRVIIPDGVGTENPEGDAYLFYMPFPNTVEEGIYLMRGDVSKLLKANTGNPAAIEYIADMMEGYL